MNATVAWSYQLLDSGEQRAFRRFGALPGLFPIDAAAEVLGGREAATGTKEAIRAAAALMDKCLLLRAETSVVASCPLYYMLETVRAYAALGLAAAGERDDAMEGLARYCVGEATLAADGLVGPAQAEWLDRVREDLESYRAALAWLIERGRATEASRIAWGLWPFWLIRGHGSEGLRWCEQILSLPSLDPEAESKALMGAAVIQYTRRELERARAGACRAMALAREAFDTSLIAQAENVLGHLESAQGRPSAARERFTAGLEGFRELEIPWGMGNALLGMAGVALSGNDIELAEGLLDEATSVLRGAGPWFLNQPLYVRAILAVRRGKPDEAIRFVRESLSCSLALHDKFAFVYALAPLAAAAVLKGDDAWGARILGARAAVTERAGVTPVDNSVQDIRERAEREARERLGPDRWARAYAAGRSASVDSLLKDIERALP
jgi:non-specific serine/threonine protein kinase